MLRSLTRAICRGEADPESVGRFGHLDRGAEEIGKFEQPAPTTGFGWGGQRRLVPCLASELDCVICGSAAIAIAEGTANRFLWVQPDGQVQFYDKRHLFSYGGENLRYVAGSERKVFHYRGWRICPQICYDLRFPAWCRNRDDYDALIFVSNWPEPRTPAWTALLKARAIENQCYVIGVNRSGKDPRGLEYAGGSAVYDPLGETVLDLGAAEGSGTTTIELAEVEAIRSQLPFLQDADHFKLF